MSRKHNHHNISTKTNWEMIISLAIIMITTLGTTVPLHIQSNNHIHAIHQEMRDFHGKMCGMDERIKVLNEEK